MPRYKSYDYLYETYISRSKSSVFIAKENNVDPKTINYYLKKLNIPIRSLGEAAIIKNGEPYEFCGDKDVLYGSLLGDASLCRRYKNSLAYFSKSNKNWDHVYFVGKNILKNDPLDRIREYSNSTKFGKTHGFTFTTRSCSYLLEEFVRWYPNNKTKIVPKNLILTPTVVLHWFLDDGHSYKDKARGTKVEVGFSTQSFTIEDCEYLQSQLLNLGIDSYLKRHYQQRGILIYLKAASVADFFKLIGDCPVPSMQYKWKIPDDLKITKGMINIKVYELIDPNGIKHVTKNGLTDFCRDKNLNASNMHAVITGRRNHHKGWKSVFQNL